MNPAPIRLKFEKVIFAGRSSLDAIDNNFSLGLSALCIDGKEAIRRI